MKDKHMNTYTVTDITVDQDGYTIVSLKNHAGNYAGVLTDYPSAPHYHQQVANCKVGDKIKL
jgi:hypothetical protein